MAIYTIKQLREQMPEFEGADDVTLVQQYSREMGVPFEDVASYLGVRPRSTGAEMGRQFIGGLVSGVPRMAGMAAQAVSEPGLPLYELGTQARQYGERQAPLYEPDLRGRGLVAEAAIKGARGIAEAAPVLGSALIPGVGLYAAPAAAAALFGGSSYQETYERVLRDTGDEEAARAAAIRTAGIQGVGEAAATTATLGLGRALRPLLPGAKTTAEVAGQMTRPGVAAPFARAYGANLAVQPATEVLQDIGSEYVARAYGAQPEDMSQIARESAVGGFGMAMLLGPVQFGSAVQRSQRATALREALAPDSQLPLETKMQAYELIQAEATRQGIPAADVTTWANEQLLREGEQIDKQIRLEEAAQMLQDWQNAVSRGDIASAMAAEQGVRGAAWVPEDQQQKIEEDFLAAYNAPSGISVREQAADGYVADRELSMGELLSRRMEQAAQGIDLTTMAGPNASTSQQAASLLRGLTANLPAGTEQVQTAGFVSPNIRQLESGIYLTEPAGQQAPAVGLTAGRAARRAPAPGIQEVAPGIFTAPVGEQFRAQRIETGAKVPPLSPVGAVPGVPPPAGSPAAPAAGAFSTAPAQPLTQRGQQAAAAGKAAAPATQQPLDPELAASLDRILEARVASERAGKVQGKISLPQGLFKGLVRMLRSPSVQPPVVYADKGAAVDPERTVQYAGQMREIYNAAQRVLLAARDLASVENNLFKSSGQETPSIKDTTPEGTIAVAEAEANELYQKVVGQRQVLNNALQALRAAAGSDANTEALVAVLKARTQKRGEKSGDTARFKEVAALLGKKSPNAISQAEYDSLLDSLISRSWNSLKQGTLDRAEAADVVRGTATRQSREGTKAGLESPLREAVEAEKLSFPFKPVTKQRPNETAEQFAARQKEAEDKYAARKEEAKNPLIAVLNYFRGLRGTGYENMLSKAILEALRNVDAKSLPKVQWIDPTDTTTKPSYNPKTDTVTLHSEASAEEALHETLHAVLQWYVHSNPNLPEVKALSAALDRVLATDISKTNLTAAQKAKAQEVVDAIRAVKTRAKDKKTADLDAVLEFISYGNTLRDFRELLKAIPSRPSPETTAWRRAVSDLYNRLIALMQRFLNVRDTVANDVVENTMSLLQKVATTEQKAPAKLTGQTLEAAVASNKAVQTASDSNAVDYRAFYNGPSRSLLSTQFVFDIVNWQRGAEKISELSTQLGDKIRADFPRATRWLSYVNSRFNVAQRPSALMETFKVEKNTGYQQMEELANQVLTRPPIEGKAIFDYLDGNTKAFDGMTGAAKLKMIADNVRDHMAMYIAELPDRERAYFQRAKFSESLLFAGRTSQVAGRRFGALDLNKLIGIERRNEKTVDGFADWMGRDANGDVILDGTYYQVFRKDPTTGQTLPEGFINIERFDQTGAPNGFAVDTTRQWRVGKFSNKNYQFVSNMTAPQAFAEGRVEDLANAMRNTMAALANNYASKRFSAEMAKLGYEDGKPTAESVAFDTLDDIRKTFKWAPDKSQVLRVSEGEAKTPVIQNLYRSSNTWVKLPNSTAYGDLAGKYVPGPVWNAMTDMVDRQPLVNFRSYNNTMRWFKKSKTVYNPGTHVTNIASNITLAMMHDIPISTIGKAASLFARYEVNPDSLNRAELELMSQFMNSGAMLGDYSSVEVKQAIYDAWRKNMSASNDANLLSRLKAFTGYEKSKAESGVQLAKRVANRLDTIATELYAAEDNVFRLAAFMKKVGELQERAGTSAPTAENFREGGDFAREAFLNYDIDSKAVRIARQSVLPFVSWTYAIMPVLGRIALYQPWKIANVLMAYYLLDVAMSSLAGDDDEARKKGPEWARDRMFGVGPNMSIRIPFLGDDKNPVYYRLGDYVPLASSVKGLPNGFLGQSWIPQAVTPGGPFISAIAGLVAGIDPYTGKDLHKATDTNLDKLWNIAKFSYDTAIPPAVSSRQIARVQDILDEKKGVTGAMPSGLPLARMFGLKFYDYNVDESQAMQVFAAKRIEREFKDEIRKLKRDEMRKGTPDYAGLTEMIQKLETRMREEMSKARGEE